MLKVRNSGLGGWKKELTKEKQTPTIQEVAVPGNEFLDAVTTCVSPTCVPPLYISVLSKHYFPLASEAFCALETGRSQGVETGGRQLGSVQGQSSAWAAGNVACR